MIDAPGSHFTVKREPGFYRREKAGAERVCILRDGGETAVHCVHEYSEDEE